MGKDTFVKGAFILALAGVVVKVIGAVNRVLVFQLLGGEGVGLYQLAYPIYLLALSVSAAGIPVAISIVVAEKIALCDYRGANKVFRLSAIVLSVLGALATSVLWLGAQWLIDCQYIRDPRAYYAIVSLAPAIFVVTLLSSYRGYFQGLNRMLPSAVSQIGEQLLRVVTMIGLAYVLLPKGIEYAAAGATFGATTGALLGLLILLYYYYRQRSVFKEKMQLQTVESRESGRSIIRRIMQLAIPISLANITVPIVDNIDIVIIPTRLEAAGYITNQATELLGYLGMAVAMINLPTILTAAIATSLVPAISEAYTLNNHQVIINNAAKALRLTVLICLPSSIGMFLLAAPISQLICGNSNAGIPIAILSVGIVFLGIQQTTTGVLQGVGRTGIAAKNMIFAAVIKIVLNYTLTGMPGMGIMGASWATVADFFFSSLLNLYCLGKMIGFILDVRQIVKVSAAAGLMGIVVVYSYDYGMYLLSSNIVSIMLAICAGIVSYGFVLFVAGGVKAEELKLVPVIGASLGKAADQMGLLRVTILEKFGLVKEKW